MLLLRDKAKGIIADHVQVASCRRVSAIQVLHSSVTTILLPDFALVSHRQCGLCGWSWAGWQLQLIVAWAVLLSSLVDWLWCLGPNSVAL